MRYLKLLSSRLFTANAAGSIRRSSCNLQVKNNSWSHIRAIQNLRFLSQDAATSRYNPLETRTDMEELFLDKRVRLLLKRLTGYNPTQVFANKSLNNLQSPKYRFMTDEQLQMEREAADTKAEAMLQMPPVKYAKERVPRILERDPQLQGFLDPSIKVILLDATPGYSDVDRLIVVREPDGTLREATTDERHRTNQIFYPIEERHIDRPPMLDEPHLDAVLQRSAYRLVLDTACLHYEPDDSRYIALCHRVYDHIASKQSFDSLLSTRHYGGMVYYYVYFRRTDPLLHHLLVESRLEEAFQLLRLYYLVNERADDDHILAILTQFTEPESSGFGELSLTQISQLWEERHRLSSVSLQQFIALLKFYIANDSSSLNVKPRLQLITQKLEEQAISELEDSAKAQN